MFGCDFLHLNIELDSPAFAAHIGGDIIKLRRKLESSKKSQICKFRQFGGSGFCSAASISCGRNFCVNRAIKSFDASWEEPQGPWWGQCTISQWSRWVSYAESVISFCEAFTLTCAIQYGHMMLHTTWEISIIRPINEGPKFPGPRCAWEFWDARWHSGLPFWSWPSSWNCGNASFSVESCSCITVTGITIPGFYLAPYIISHNGLNSKPSQMLCETLQNCTHILE